jgi:hypothetical protein
MRPSGSTIIFFAEMIVEPEGLSVFRIALLAKLPSD